MRTAKISELKAKLSAYIEFVKNGEDVLILDRNKPIAWLVGPGPVKEEDARRRRLIIKGVITPARDPENRAGFIPVPAGDHPISQEVMDQIWAEERDGR
ncbi:MAG: type II toxin-antitoxin system Phd/YefM family antitoxin [Terracidiphilus sp.]|jgi:antitoxin (DNA-binding transcriptional repressor) of toxin-antitoxin stability system